MKLFASLALAVAATCAWCQMGPPPGGMGQAGPPRRMGGGMGQNQGQTQAQAGAQNSRSNQGAQTTTETIRLLSMAKVQNELGIDARQYASLSTIARSARSSTATEEQVLGAVAKVLTTAQTNRLTELLVQDLGYRSLGLSTVRSKLDLKDDQTTAIDAIVSSADAAKKAGASSQALSNLRSKVDVALAKLLTADQDAKLRSLAGKGL